MLNNKKMKQNNTMVGKTRKKTHYNGDTKEYCYCCLVYMMGQITVISSKKTRLFAYIVRQRDIPNAVKSSSTITLCKWTDAKTTFDVDL